MLLCNVAWTCQGSSIKRRLFWISGIHLGIKNKCLCTKWQWRKMLRVKEKNKKGAGGRNTSKKKKTIGTRQQQQQHLFSVYQIRTFLVNSCYFHHYHDLIGYLVCHQCLVLLIYALEMFLPFLICLFLLNKRMLQ